MDTIFFVIIEFISAVFNWILSALGINKLLSEKNKKWFDWIIVTLFFGGLVLITVVYGM